LTVSIRYVCAECGASAERSYVVPTLVRTCGECGAWGHFVREELLVLADRVPEDDRPEDWEKLSGEEKMRVAMQKGHVTISDLRA
jgi:predicted ATP-dependent serine protease